MSCAEILIAFFIIVVVIFEVMLLFFYCIYHALGDYLNCFHYIKLHAMTLVVFSLYLSRFVW